MFKRTSRTLSIEKTTSKSNEVTLELEFDPHKKMSENRVNQFYRERCSGTKICANCNLQATDQIGNSWVMECFCGCNATAKLCSTCLKEHSKLFPLRICFSVM